mmetsp:Transcript_40373/g.115079  ORF Transcript_40373/g.115079 Transcript_40373/m.115079 type:complete len:123 (-) Transcript_40373:175-543(-)
MLPVAGGVGLDDIADEIEQERGLQTRLAMSESAAIAFGKSGEMPKEPTADSEVEEADTNAAVDKGRWEQHEQHIPAHATLLVLLLPVVVGDAQAAMRGMAAVERYVSAHCSLRLQKALGRLI